MLIRLISFAVLFFNSAQNVFFEKRKIVFKKFFLRFSLTTLLLSSVSIDIIIFIGSKNKKRNLLPWYLG
jgi:hypothetical protein